MTKTTSSKNTSGNVFLVRFIETFLTRECLLSNEIDEIINFLTNSYSFVQILREKQTKI